MTRMICLRASSDCKRLTKHENTGLGWVIAASRSVCDTPSNSFFGGGRENLKMMCLKLTGESVRVTLHEFGQPFKCGRCFRGGLRHLKTHFLQVAIFFAKLGKFRQ